MDNIGLFGGSFNPIHNGHLGIARAFADEIGLDTVLFLPAGTPYHKGGGTIPASARMDMVQAALAEAAVWRGVGDGRVLKGLFFLPCGQGEKARYAAPRKGCQRYAQQGNDVAPQHAARIFFGLQQALGGWVHIVGGDGCRQCAGFHVNNQRNCQ